MHRATPISRALTDERIASFAQPLSARWQPACRRQQPKFLHFSSFSRKSTTNSLRFYGRACVTRVTLLQAHEAASRASQRGDGLARQLEQTNHEIESANLAASQLQQQLAVQQGESLVQIARCAALEDEVTD